MSQRFALPLPGRRKRARLRQPAMLAARCCTHCTIWQGAPARERRELLTVRQGVRRRGAALSWPAQSLSHTSRQRPAIGARQSTASRNPLWRQAASLARQRHWLGAGRAPAWKAHAWGACGHASPARDGGWQRDAQSRRCAGCPKACASGPHSCTSGPHSCTSGPNSNAACAGHILPAGKGRLPAPDDVNIVNNRRIVDVSVNRIPRRRRHIPWGIDPNRHGNEHWDREHKNCRRRRRRREGNKDWRRRQEDNRRRRHEAKRRIVENKHRTINVNDLRRRRRRHIIGNRGE